MKKYDVMTIQLATMIAEHTKEYNIIGPAMAIAEKLPLAEILLSYVSWCENEYDVCADDILADLAAYADINTASDNVSTLSIAYTTYDFSDGREREIQVDYDLKQVMYMYYIDGTLTGIEPCNYNNAAYELSNCEFMDYIRAALDQCKEV